MLAKKFKDYEADQPRNDGNCKIREGENVVDGEREGFPLSIGASEFTHQEIRIEEEDDKADFNSGSPNGGRLMRVIVIRGHG